MMKSTLLVYLALVATTGTLAAAIQDAVGLEEAALEKAFAARQLANAGNEGGVNLAAVDARSQSVDDPHVAAQTQHQASTMSNVSTNTVIFVAVVTGCSIAGVVGLIVAGVCWYRLQKNVKAASDVDYPAYGVTGPTKERLPSPSDRKLAQSAQMYHYQHQKQQMIAMEKAQGELHKEGSDADSDEENEEGDYTVFECPGLAPTGEMEVKNPLFSEETPVTPGPDHHK